MRALLFTCVALALPLTATAETVTVRSGEHDDFTRLVFNLPESTDFSSGKLPDGAGIRLTFSAPVSGFDISEVFSRVPRTRILELIPQGGAPEIDIRLGCNCESRVFQFQDSMLVVDILDGESRGEADAEKALVVPELRLDTFAGEANTSSNRLLPGFDSFLPADIGALGEPQAQGLGVGLTADLRSAAENGFLVANPRAPMVATGPKLQSETTAKEPALLLAEDAGQADRLAADLARELQVLKVQDTDQVSIGASGCTSDDLLDIESWADGDMAPALAGTARQMFGEFDRLDESAVTGQVKELLHYGFGAEARNVMKLMVSPPDRVLHALSYHVDGEPDPARTFASQTACIGDAALWSLLSLETASTSGPVDATSVMRAFEALPDHLRAHLGPLLANGFIELNAPGDAREILRRTERGIEEVTPEVELGQAQIEAQIGNAQEASAALDAIVEKGGQTAPLALARRVDIAKENGDSVSDSDVELSAAFSEELRYGTNGPQIWLSHIRALLVSKRFDDAATALVDREGVPDATAEAARVAFFASLATEAADVTFLKYALPEGSVFAPENTELDYLLAKRFLALGLPENALQKMSHLEGSRDSEDGKLLRARALLALSRPEAAEIILIGMQGEDVSRLRASAREAMGDYDFAQTVYDDLEEQERIPTAAWLAGNWTTVAESADPALAQAAELMLTETTLQDFGDAGLQSFRDLSSQSASSRQSIREMLESTRVPLKN